MNDDRNETGSWTAGPDKFDENSKQRQLSAFTEECEGQRLATDQGVKVYHTDDALKTGDRGPILMEEFHFGEKLTHFDHERIPERGVHARGTGAHGYFQVYKSMAEYSSAKFLQDPAVKTPVFVRFSTVVGFRGSAPVKLDREPVTRSSAGLSFTAFSARDIRGRKVAVLASNGFDTSGSVLFDAVYIPGGQASVDELKGSGDVKHFVNEAFRHAKPLGASGHGVELMIEHQLGFRQEFLEIIYFIHHDHYRGYHAMRRENRPHVS